MKTKYISICRSLLFSTLIAIAFSSCIEETFPEDDTATLGQVEQSEGAVEALTNAVMGYFNQYDSYNASYSFDLGYASYGIMRDVMCNDYHIKSSSYNYYTAYGTCRNIGFIAEPVVMWSYYYKLVNRANAINFMLELNEESEVKREYLGIALSIRAHLYMDLARFYEYKKTGIDKLDNDAQQREIYGLTVPIVTKDMTEEEARNNNPRQPFYIMYEYIYNDLNLAEDLLKDYKRASKNMPDIGVVYGLKARFWLELASRFTKYPNDLTTLLNNVDLGINSKENCYEKAAEYARKAINVSGAKCLSKNEWYGGSNYTTAFNSINSGSWMWGTILTQENIKSTWKNIAGHVFAEQKFGVGGPSYGAYRLIDKRLFEQIPDADWRKTTWLAAEDAGKIPANKYRTVLADNDFKKLPAYTGLKFKPNAGNVSNGNIGAVIDAPLMRVEEMYFIEAEGLAGSKGVQSGIAALESFMNTYRYDTGIESYRCIASSLDEFQEALILQKRIEFWGEGIIYWDYKRLEYQVVRGYSGTNATVGHRLNSIKGFCPPWFNIVISYYEESPNTLLGAKKNPDPSQAILDWDEE